MNLTFHLSLEIPTNLNDFRGQQLLSNVLVPARRAWGACGPQVPTSPGKIRTSTWWTYLQAVHSL